MVAIGCAIGIRIVIGVQGQAFVKRIVELQALLTTTEDAVAVSGNLIIGQGLAPQSHIINIAAITMNLVLVTAAKVDDCFAVMVGERIVPAHLGTHHIRFVIQDHIIFAGAIVTQGNMAEDAGTDRVGCYDEWCLVAVHVPLQQILTTGLCRDKPQVADTVKRQHL